MENKQLFEKSNNQYNPFFPIVRLEDIIDKISDKSIQWILNNYSHIYVEYSESRERTRNKVPQILRRNGLWISYNNGKKNITEYYIGENTNVNNYVEWTLDDNWKEFDELTIQDKSITYQHLSDALRELVAGGNTITNFPDEEDITSDGTVLSFKDRDYKPNNFSGLGRVILRKNITVDKDGNAKNILTQDMIDKENTIYEIRYDFDLNDKEINIRKGCVLDFRGGYLSNGVLVFNNTSLSSPLKKIFNNISFKGSANVDFIHPEWWGAKADDFTDCIEALEHAVSFSDCIVRNSLLSDNITSSDWHDMQKKINHATISLVQGVYCIGRSWNISKPVNIFGNGATIKAIQDRFVGENVIHITDVVSFNQGIYKDLIVEGSENDVIGILAYSNTSVYDSIYVKDCYKGGIKCMRANTFNGIKIITTNKEKWNAVSDFKIYGLSINSSDGYITNLEVAGYPVGVFLSGSATGWLVSNVHVWGIGCVMRTGIYNTGEYNYFVNLYCDTIVKQNPNLGYVDIVGGIENGGMAIYEKWNHINHYQNVHVYINQGIFEDANEISRDNLVAYFNGDRPAINTISVSANSRYLMNPKLVYYNLDTGLNYPNCRGVIGIREYTEWSKECFDQSYRIKYDRTNQGFEGFNFSTRNIDDVNLDKFRIQISLKDKQALWGQYKDNTTYVNYWNGISEEYDSSTYTKTIGAKLKANSFVGSAVFNDDNYRLILNKNGEQFKYQGETTDDNNNLIIKESFGRSGKTLAGVEYSLGLADYGISSIKAKSFIGNIQSTNGKILCINEKGKQIIYLSESEGENENLLTIQQVFGRTNHSLVTITYSIDCVELGNAKLKAKTFVGNCINSDGLHYSIHENGDSFGRPTSNLFVGRFYFDETLNKPIWWTGSRWVDATGAEV